jgi:predicted Rossmann fold nucleotide-binding protein DprA/Smf involved in DNA uptake
MSKTEATLSDQALKVFDLVRLAGWEGKTCDEIEAETGLSHQAASARLHDLEKLNKVARRGARRKTRAGRGAAIYVQAELLDAQKRAGKDG